LRDTSRPNLKVFDGAVTSLNIRYDNGYIKSKKVAETTFFNFTAIPGEGYHTLKQGASVTF